MNSLNDYGHFMNGFIAITIGVVITQPGSALKTYAMSGRGLPPIGKLYNGCLANVLSGGPAEGITFLTHNIAHTALKNQNGTVSDAENLAVSAFSGALGAVVVSPCERIMIQQQIHSGSIFSVLKPMVAKEGAARALLKGLVPAIYRDAVFNCGVFALNEMAQRQWKDAIPNKEYRDLVAGISVGAGVGALSTPFDRIKTEMQIDTEGEYTTMRNTATKLVRTFGAQTLFQGAMTRSMLIGGMIYCMEKSKEIAPRYFPQSLKK